MFFWPLIILLNYDLFVEMLEKMDIRQFMKRKSISDSRSVKSISCKSWRMRFDRPQTNGV